MEVINSNLIDSERTDILRKVKRGLLNETSSSKVVSLDLSFQSLSNIPDFVFKLKNLKTLKLDHNRIEKIPKELEHLTSLEELDLSSNQIQKIPAFLSQMPSLLRVDISYNKVTEIPRNFHYFFQADRTRYFTTSVYGGQTYTHHSLNQLDKRGRPAKQALFRGGVYAIKSETEKMYKQRIQFDGNPIAEDDEIEALTSPSHLYDYFLEKQTALEEEEEQAKALEQKELSQLQEQKMKRNKIRSELDKKQKRRNIQKEISRQREFKTSF